MLPKHFETHCVILHQTSEPSWFSGFHQGTRVRLQGTTMSEKKQVKKTIKSWDSNLPFERMLCWCLWHPPLMIVICCCGAIALARFDRFHLEWCPRNCGRRSSSLQKAWFEMVWIFMVLQLQKEPSGKWLLLNEISNLFMELRVCFAKVLIMMVPPNLCIND